MARKKLIISASSSFGERDARGTESSMYSPSSSQYTAARKRVFKDLRKGLITASQRGDSDDYFRLKSQQSAFGASRRFYESQSNFFRARAESGTGTAASRDSLKQMQDQMRLDQAQFQMTTKIYDELKTQTRAIIAKDRGGAEESLKMHQARVAQTGYKGIPTSRIAMMGIMQSELGGGQPSLIGQRRNALWRGAGLGLSSLGATAIGAGSDILQAKAGARNAFDMLPGVHKGKASLIGGAVGFGLGAVATAFTGMPLLMGVGAGIGASIGGSIGAFSGATNLRHLTAKHEKMGARSMFAAQTGVLGAYLEGVPEQKGVEGDYQYYSRLDRMAREKTEKGKLKWYSVQWSRTRVDKSTEPAALVKNVYSPWNTEGVDPRGKDVIGGETRIPVSRKVFNIEAHTKLMTGGVVGGMKGGFPKGYRHQAVPDMQSAGLSEKGTYQFASEMALLSGRPWGFTALDPQAPYLQGSAIDGQHYSNNQSTIGAGYNYGMDLRFAYGAKKRWGSTYFSDVMSGSRMSNNSYGWASKVAGQGARYSGGNVGEEGIAASNMSKIMRSVAKIYGRAETDDVDSVSGLLNGIARGDRSSFDMRTPMAADAFGRMVQGFSRTGGGFTNMQTLGALAGDNPEKTLYELNLMKSKPGKWRSNLASYEKYVHGQVGRGSENAKFMMKDMAFSNLTDAEADRMWFGRAKELNEKGKWDGRYKKDMIRYDSVMEALKTNEAWNKQQGLPSFSSAADAADAGVTEIQTSAAEITDEYSVSLQRGKDAVDAFTKALGAITWKLTDYWSGIGPKEE